MAISWVFWEETCLIVPKPTNGQIDWNNIHRKSRKNSNLTPRFLRARDNILYMLWCICYTYAKAHFLCAGGARLQVFFDVPRALGRMCTVEVQFKSMIERIRAFIQTNSRSSEEIEKQNSGQKKKRRSVNGKDRQRE